VQWVIVLVLYSSKAIRPKGECPREPALELGSAPQDFSDLSPSELSAVQHCSMSEINISAGRRYQYGENAGSACALRHAQQSVHGAADSSKCLIR
jgi:hypothetical protein